MQAVRLGDVRRILVLSRNNIGDCLLTTPLMRALKRRFPRAHLAVSVPAYNRDLLVTNPHVDELVLRPEIKRWAAKCRFAIEMRRGSYDLIVSLQEKSAFYAWATWYAALCNSRRPVTVGLHHRRTRRWYQHNVPVRPDQHEVYKYLNVAELLGCPRERRPVLELLPTREAQGRVEQFLAGEGIDPDVRFVAINPGGSTPDKRWPVERFAEVGDRLHSELGLPVMVLGGPADQDRAAQIVARMGHRPVVAAGRVSLGDTAALLERCQLLVTGDTGPMHMAVALAVPVVALFGPTSPVKFGPFTTLSTFLRHDAPCPDCRDAQRIRATQSRKNDARALFPCLHTIQPDDCVEAALRLYTAPPPSRVRANQRQAR